MRNRQEDPRHCQGLRKEAFSGTRASKTQRTGPCHRSHRASSSPLLSTPPHPRHPLLRPWLQVAELLRDSHVEPCGFTSHWETGNAGLGTGGPRKYVHELLASVSRDARKVGREFAAATGRRKPEQQTDCGRRVRRREPGHGAATRGKGCGPVLSPELASL